MGKGNTYLNLGYAEEMTTAISDLAQNWCVLEITLVTATCRGGFGPNVANQQAGRR